MAITDIQAFAHLTAADIETLGQELDSIRRSVEQSRGARDAKYIRRTIAAQRGLEVAGRAVLFGSRNRWAWLTGTALLSVAKIIENMELGHNVSHGQWDWMNDPEIHSSSWEWDMTGPSSQWRRAHNYSHHTYTNVLGKDEDLGFGILRMTRDEPWKPIHLVQPVANLVLAATFEWGIALHDWSIEKELADTPRWEVMSPPNVEFGRKIARQVTKDFLLYPALTGPAFKSTLKANATANLIRNLWAYAVIFCGHFPDGAEKFTIEQLEGETSGEWYLRQMLGSANFKAGPAMAFMSGNLCYQIEHHLFPDLPSNRYPEIAVRVRELCDKYDLPYTTGSLGKQYLLAFRTIHKLALPDRFLKATSDNAPETSSERKFAGITLPSLPSAETAHWLGVDPETGQRRGLRSALREAKVVLKEKAQQEKEMLREAKRALKEKAEHEKVVLREATQALQDRARQEQASLRRKAVREKALWRLRRSR
ncbi:fatty acid desaturase family protein [Nocardia brasiliensis]|uniref:Putative fatty acid desaturase n=1 Tax=Nocardia brasiliensis (strain ATCC 700358 / HUJEG-1) TaxID=1133849 RepID=K0EYH4_NOCB7|nr:fatty acid desaturase [Nocardia brasiliensis]AFU04953.1 putative fatty acid desaturase [Nocardia brasiliensis ATCC 700358]OCF85448.1 fatty acid desaturase [Nocardia brasiliensis]